MKGKGWVGAAHLGIGTEIVTRAGPRLVVKSVTPHRRPAGYKVYNFTVGQDHSYFVGEAGGGVWVHNVDCDVQELVDLINQRYPGLVRDSNFIRNGVEIDIETENAIIEVKSGNGKGLADQIKRRLETDLNPTGKPVIGYSPNMGPWAARSINANGGIAAGGCQSSLEDLLQLLAP